MIEVMKKLYSLPVPDELLIKVSDNIYKFIESSNILEFNFEIDCELEE
ncbi:MAG: hypothetical protein LZ172_00690 [Thaumarchaeota archaeon]|jgi:hypothetical protein|nr:hypothetical protein [Candidatus Geocrenenecus arthurdayi]MCL7389954.1 hypothetical protein [Candidatus Geocrenenecus arthurdayi]MCL7391482.1 hypothetical protein [Candidatus Geocrenenecus arthurdayi]MCL7396344.1 hypothetical protein [Candidatus Geocrenenecus arthurdayi]MCL7402856.1 hypothetical protein [Candidatus Geocrenenecus arthurdayi]